MNRYQNWLTLALLWWAPVAISAVDHVILVSIDGLRPDVISALGKSELPGFYRFHEEGVWTNNAHTDFDYTRTLPNHSSMMTARPVIGPNGHGQELNHIPLDGMTLHNNTGDDMYVSSVFDVVHDHGLSTALYASKDKFILFKLSYDERGGAADVVGEDNGRNKLDDYVYQLSNRSAASLIDQFLLGLEENKYNFSFLHITDPDSAGHRNNWTTTNYENAVKRVDGYLQKIFTLVDKDSVLQANTAIILTADHGGTGESHSDATDPLNYRVPFYVWSTEVAAGADLYQINQHSRQEPGDSRPGYEAEKQPIRNGDAANLALDLLGLPAIPDAQAVINKSQDLNITAP